jgi:hypothetical protein
MNYGLIICAIIISACSSLTNYQEQLVVDLGANNFKTTCNGMAEAFDSCYRKAKRTCANGYDMIEKTQLKDFVHREITFKCK